MPSINILGPGAFVRGEIQVNGDFRMDGTLVGTIQCKGKIVVGPTGKIDGDVQCQSADFSGEVTAQVRVAELLTLKEMARFSGDIITGKLAIEPGAKFSGTCKMEASEMKETRGISDPNEIRPSEKS